MTSKALEDAYNSLNASLRDRKEYDRLFVFTDASAANELAQRILIDREPSKNLLTGIKGCGKSTELLRLLRDVEDSYIGVYYSMREDADVRKVTPADILLSGLLHIFLAATDRGIDLGEPSVKAIAAWLQDALATARVDFEQRRLDQKTLAGKVRKVMSTMKAQKVRESIQPALEERKGELVESIDRLVREVEAASKKKVLMAVDDLDKLPLDRAKEVFAEQGDILTSPACKSVYTVPYSLVHTNEFRDVARTFKKYVNQGPAMVVGRGAKDGAAAMRDVVSKRMSLDLIEDKALDSAISSTGGVVADLLRVLAEACIKARTEGKEAIDVSTVDAVLDDIRKDGTRTLSAADCQLLGKVHKDKMADYDDTFLRLIDDGYILEYTGEEGKYYVHPLVIPVLKEKKAI